MREVNPKLTGYDSGNNVLNGIAVSLDEPHVLFITGKMWSLVFKVKISADETTQNAENVVQPVSNHDGGL